MFISNSWIILLSILEITIILLLFVRLQPLRTDRLLLFRYFLYQTLTRLCLISFFLGVLSIHLAWVILFIKLILPPFHVWFLIRIKFADRKTFFWVMIVIKLPVFLILILILVFFLEEYGKLLILLFWSRVLSLILLWSRRNLLFFLMSSSFLHTLWSILRLLVSKNMFFCYYFLYSLVLISLISSLYRRFEFLLTNEWRWDIYFALFIFSSVPPSSIFLIKWRLLFSLMELNVFFIFDCSYYFRCFFISLFSSDNNNDTSWNWKIANL